MNKAQPQAAAPAGQPAANHGFEFVTSLARDLSLGNIQLPAMPEVAAKVRAALENDNVSAERLERIVSAEPVLAARILQLANSAALNFTGRKVSELRTAISRVGFAMVRTTSMAFALAQLKLASSVKTIEQPLNELWNRSTLVAAMCRVVAMRVSKVNADTAMLAGLLHGVGELYILARASSHAELFGSEMAYRDIVSDWHPAIAKAILESWGIAEEIGAAIGDFENHERTHPGAVDLTDVLTMGYLLATYMNHPESLELNMSDVAICRRLALTRADYETLINGSKDEISALREALQY